jgi:hypothetical protein
VRQGWKQQSKKPEFSLSSLLPGPSYSYRPLVESACGTSGGMAVPSSLPQGQINIMMELKVTLDFACCTCTRPVGVTLKCEGKGLAAGSTAVAAVLVPCPNCAAINQLYFEPSGTVRAVAPYRITRQMPVPSLN